MISHLRSPQAAMNGNQLPRVDSTFSVRVGYMLQEQGSSDLKRVDRSDKSDTDGHTRIVRIRSKQRMETHVSHNSDQY